MFSATKGPPWEAEFYADAMKQVRERRQIAPVFRAYGLIFKRQVTRRTERQRRRTRYPIRGTSALRKAS
jgi:hypothetical protein